MTIWVVGLSLGVTLLVILMFVLATELERVHSKLARSQAKLDACHWLAEFHARYNFALQDYVMEREQVGMPTLSLRLRAYRQAANRRRYLVHVPLAECPPILRRAAIAFNEDERTAWPGLPWRDVDGGQLRAAEHVAQMLATRLGRFTAPLAAKTEASSTVVGVVLDELELLLDAEVRRMQEPLDKEEVLAKEY